MNKSTLFALIVALIAANSFSYSDGHLRIADISYYNNVEYSLTNDSIFVEVTDPDLDTSASVRETLFVHISSSVEPAGDSIKLIETWSGNGWVLRGAIYVDSSATPVSGDRKIQAVVGDMITVRYHESANLYGEPVVHQKKLFVAKTIKSGGSAGNETWPLSGSPYFVSENFTVNSSDTVTIAAGSILVFPVNRDPWSEGVKLTVYGHLVANGTLTDSIYFESLGDTPTRRDWRGIEVYNGSINLRYCVLRNSTYGVNWYYSSNFVFKSSRVSHSSFVRHENALRHEAYNSPYKSLIIDSNYIELFALQDSSSVTGIYSTQGTTYSDTFKIFDNKIKINQETSSATFFYGMQLTGRDSSATDYSRAVIERNLIWSDSGYPDRQANGIYLSYFKATDIKSNRISGFSKGVYFGCHNFGTIFEDNILTRNHIDAYIDCEPGIALRNNAFASNSAGGYGVYNSHYSDVDARNVYWGETARAQMNSGSNPKNITRIYDKFDYSGVGQVLYSGWLSDTNGTPTPSGIDGEIKILDMSYMTRGYCLVGQSIRVRIIDSDLNLDPGVMETIKISFSTGVETTDTLFLQETSINSDTFEVVALVENNPTPSLKDGKIQVLYGQMIEFTYRDALTGYGSAVDKKIVITVPKTVVSSVSGNTIWNSTNSPYWLDGSITVWAGDTLEIQQGTRVWMKANKSQEYEQYGDTINVFGHLKVIGASGDSVHIGPVSTAPAIREWFGIRAYGTGSVSLKYAKLTNAYRGVELWYEYSGSVCFNRISHSLISSAKTAVYGYNSESQGITIIIDSSKFVSAPADTVSDYLVNMAWYGYNNSGDSLLISDNEFSIHSSPSYTSNNKAVYLYGRRALPGFKKGYFQRNIIKSDSLPGIGHESSHLGIELSDMHSLMVQNNRFSRFITAMRITGDSGSIYSGNIFNENQHHIYIGWGEKAGRFQGNAFSHPLSGGYAFYNNSSPFVDARNNYWGGPATSEMNSGGNPKNISVIHDMFDEASRGQVQYAGWLSDTNGTPSATGTAGMLKLAISDTVSRDWYLPGDTMIILLTDPDLNTNGSVTETVKISISSNQEASDTITLTEHGTDSSLFTATVVIDESGTPVYGDGKLQALPGSDIVVRYQDMQNNFGQPQLVMRKALLAKTYLPSGPLSYGTVLDHTQSPYIMGGSISVMVGDTLKINQGTRIITRKREKINPWDSDNGDTISVYGHLQVDGVAGDSVYFDTQREEKYPGSWYGIRVENGGTFNIRHASFWNTECALDIYTSNYDTNYVNFRLTNSKVNNAKRAMIFNSSTSEKMTLRVNNNSFDIVLPDTFATDAFYFHYNWSNGDSLIFSDNRINLHNRRYSRNGAAIRIQNRNSGPECIQALIIRNIISADTATVFSNDFSGIYIAQARMIKVDTNEIYRFSRGIYISDDSGIVIQANKFEGNNTHIERNYTYNQSNSYANNNDFGPFMAGGYAIRMAAESNGFDFDARYNYWGPSITAEMNGGGNPKNISGILDFYDNSTYGKVTYSGWRSTPALNVPPVFTSAPSLAILQGRVWTYEMTATDANGDAIVFELTSVPADIEQTGNTLSFRPMVAGNYEFVLSAVAGGQTTQQIFTLVVNADTDRPSNPLTLTANAVSDSAIALSWNHDALIGTDIDSIGIWATSSTYPDSAPYEGGVLYSHRFSKSESNAMVSYLWPKLGLYFSLFVMDSAGNWSVAPSQTYAQTLDLQPPEPVVGFWIEHLSADSVRLHWSSSVSTDVDSLAICVRTDSIYPVNQFDGAIGAVPGTITSFRWSGLPENTTARFSIYARDTSGNWSTAATYEVYMPRVTKPVNNLVLSATPIRKNLVRLKWNPALIAGDGVMHVEVMWGMAKPKVWRDTSIALQYMIMPSLLDSVTDIGIEENEDYWFALFVVDSFGLGSDTTTAAMKKVNSNDFIPPANPLVLSAEVLSEHSARLSWDLSALNGTPISQISLYYGHSKMTHREDTNGVHIMTYFAPFDSEYTAAFLEGKKDYWFTLFVRDSFTNSSDTATLAMKKITTPDQTSPNSIAALHVDYVGLGTLAFSWNPSNSPDAEQVVVRYRTDGFYPDSISDGLLLKNYSPLDTADTLSVFTEGVDYQFTFFVIDSSGNVSPPMPWNQAQIQVKTPAQNVNNVLVSAIDTSTIGVRLDYAGAFADSFLVRVDTARHLSSATNLSAAITYAYMNYFNPNDTLKIFSGLKSGSLYYVTVSAFNQGFISDTINDFKGATVLTPSVGPAAPIFVTSFTDTLQTLVDSLFFLNLIAVDANNDALGFYFLQTPPSGMTLNPTTGALSWTPTIADTNIYTVSIYVSDGSLRDTLSFVLKALNINQPPVFITTAGEMPQWIPEKVLWTKQIRVYDPDSARGDKARLFLDIAPTGMVIDSTTNVLSWTPSASQISALPNYEVYIRAVDNKGLTAVLNFSIGVQNVNDKPVLNTYSSKDTAYQDILFRKIYAAVDPDMNEVLVYRLVSGPTGMTIDSTNGRISFTPVEGQFGNTTFSISVTDAGGLFDTLSVTLTMINRNDPPVISTTLNTETIQEKAAKTWTLAATDPDVSDILRWKKLVGPTTLTVDSLNGSVLWVPQNNDVGTHTITIAVYDKEGLSDTLTFLVVVENTNDIPTITITEGPLVNFGAVKIKFSANDVDRRNGIDSTLTISAVITVSDSSVPLLSKTISLRKNDSLFEFYPVNDGVYDIKLTVKDQAADSSTAIKKFSIGGAGQSVTSNLFVGGNWIMASVPTDSSAMPSTLTDTNRSVAVWSPSKKQYVYANSGFSALKRGSGFWIYSMDSVRINTPKSLVNPSLSGSCTLRVDTGWNMISSPYAYPVKLPLSDPLRHWSLTTENYDTTSIMEPWKGYFVYSLNAQPIVLTGNPFNPDSTEKRSLGKTRQLNKDAGEWLVNIIVVSGGKHDLMNSFGSMIGASDFHDTLDMTKPPPAPNGGPIIAFVQKGSSQMLDRSVTAPFSGTKEWLLYAEPAAGENQLELTFTATDLPEKFRMYIDNSGDCFDITENNKVALKTIDGRYVSVFVSDDPNFLSKRVNIFELAQNTPNPFNPATSINFSLPRTYSPNGKPVDGSVLLSLKIYNTHGKLVRILAIGKYDQGRRYSTMWDGKSDNGKPLSSGLYFYKLEAGTWKATRKMVMVK